MVYITEPSPIILMLLILEGTQIFCPVPIVLEISALPRDETVAWSVLKIDIDKSNVHELNWCWILYSSLVHHF